MRTTWKNSLLANYRGKNLELRATSNKSGMCWEGMAIKVKPAEKCT